MRGEVLILVYILNSNFDSFFFFMQTGYRESFLLFDLCNLIPVFQSISYSFDYLFFHADGGEGISSMM